MVDAAAVADAAAVLDAAAAVVNAARVVKAAASVVFVRPHYCVCWPAGRQARRRAPSLVTHGFICSARLSLPGPTAHLQHWRPGGQRSTVGHHRRGPEVRCVRLRPLFVQCAGMCRRAGTHAMHATSAMVDTHFSKRSRWTMPTHAFSKMR